MKCSKCNHEAVRIKKGHFCPGCGSRVTQVEQVAQKATVSPQPQQKVNTCVRLGDIPTNQQPVLQKQQNIINLKEATASSNNQVLPSGAYPQKDVVKEPIIEQEIIPKHIKGIIEKHTEKKQPKTVNHASHVASVAEIKKEIKIENPIKEIPQKSVVNVSSSNYIAANHVGASSAVLGEKKSAQHENIFSNNNQQKTKDFWQSSNVAKNVVKNPSKKEKTLKKMLTLVIGLNVLVILGIVYLLLI